MLLQSAARLSPSAQILEDIARPDCNLAVWQRHAIPGLASLLDDPTHDIRFDASLTEFATSLADELSAAGYPGGDLRAALERDISQLAERFSMIMSLARLEVRLEVVTTDSCRKFHADDVAARLITSYVGTGTQWLEREEVERMGTGQEPLHIRTLGTGNVGIFKGKLATDNPAIHRSPPIAGTGEKRLLLVLNPAQNR